MDSRLVEKYISFVDEISDLYQYDSNIKHLLYLIIPSFVTKYSIYKEKIILDTFSKVQIVISDEVQSQTQAYYTSIPYYDNNDNILTKKYIVIQNYENISLVQLMDDLVHEFNHAINSYQKELLIKDSILFVRTGISYSSYSIPDFSAIKKDDSYVLEEVLNTNQTEEIINLIKNYHDPSHQEFNHTIDSFNYETDDFYSSQAYYLENILMKSILKNKTFLSTLNNLRFSGDVSDVEEWFDHITGEKNSYANLIRFLKELMSLEDKLNHQKYFRNITIHKIKDLIDKILNIIFIFNQNCNYK